MYMEAADCGAGKPSDLNREHIIPSVFDERVVAAVASAVQRAARQEGIAQLRRAEALSPFDRAS